MSLHDRIRAFSDQVVAPPSDDPAHVFALGRQRRQRRLASRAFVTVRAVVLAASGIVAVLADTSAPEMPIVDTPPELVPVVPEVDITPPEPEPIPEPDVAEGTAPDRDPEPEPPEAQEPDPEPDSVDPDEAHEAESEEPSTETADPDGAGTDESTAGDGPAATVSEDEPAQPTEPETSEQQGEPEPEPGSRPLDAQVLVEGELFLSGFGSEPAALFASDAELPPSLDELFSQGVLNVDFETRRLIVLNIPSNGCLPRFYDVAVVSDTVTVQLAKRLGGEDVPPGEEPTHQDWGCDDSGAVVPFVISVDRYGLPEAPFNLEVIRKEMDGDVHESFQLP